MPDADGDDRLTAHVGHVLRWVWDPIDLGAHGPEDEYDAYVPVLVALARDTAVFECAHLAHLARIEVEAMHLTLSPAKRTRAARALLGLRQAHLGRTDRFVAQWTSPDGLRCAWVFETPRGQYVYEDGVLRHEDDENGPWSWWDGTGLGRSGLYETAEAAGRESHAVIGWLRAGDLGASASVAMPWRDALAWRALDPRERTVLDRLLAADFPGRNELVAQARTALVRRIDDAGSLRFRVKGAPAAIVERVPVEGRYREGEDLSGPGVNLLLHVVGGRLHELEVFKYDGLPICVGPFEVPPDRIEVWPD